MSVRRKTLSGHVPRDVSIDILIRLPRDVLIDIFMIRLPIKTLIRCTCVCKSWYSFLTGRNCNHNNGDLLLVRSIRRNTEKLCPEQYSVHFDNKGFGKFAELEFPFKTPENYFFRIIGSCNGLICFSDDTVSDIHNTILWNPSIGKSLSLPTPRVTYASHGPFVHTSGFGFDPLTNDYKVVRIVYLDCEPKIEIDIYTVSTDTWRDISHLGLPYLIGERAPQAYLNRRAHWIASEKIDSQSYCHLVLFFDMSDEKFGKLELPDSLARLNRVPKMRVSVFQKLLSVFEYAGPLFDEKSWSIWVMEKYGMQNSWTKKFSISSGLGIRSLVGLKNNGESLVAKSDGHLYSYNSEAEQFRDLGIHGSTESLHRYSFHADAYTHSLGLLASNKKERKQIKEEREEQASVAA